MAFSLSPIRRMLRELVDEGAGFCLRVELGQQALRATPLSAPTRRDNGLTNGAYQGAAHRLWTSPRRSGHASDGGEVGAAIAPLTRLDTPAFASRDFQIVRIAAPLRSALLSARTG